MRVSGVDLQAQEIDTLRAPVSILSNTQSDCIVLSSAREPSSYAKESGSASTSVRHYAICLQVFVVGLCLEGALALCLFGLYHVAYARR